jgi:hypothetical protein
LWLVLSELLQLCAQVLQLTLKASNQRSVLHTLLGHNPLLY